MKKIFLLLIVFFLSSCSFDILDKEENINEDGKYKISIANDIKNGQVKADKTVAAKGEVVSLTTIPDEGYLFDYFLIQSVVQTENTFVMPDCDVTIYAYFTSNENKVYNINVNENITNGSIRVSKTAAYYNEEVEVFVTPDENYELNTLYVNDQLVDDLKFNMPNKDVLITATFKRINKDNTCQHDYISSIIKPADCYEQGIRLYTCNNCDDSYSETIDKLNHNYINNKCTNCGSALQKSYLNELFGNEKIQ